MKNYFLQILFSSVAAILVVAGSAGAAIVGPAGYTNAFGVQPPAADWVTFNRPGGGADNFDMDSDVGTNIVATSVTTQTTSDSGNPAFQNANATWSSTGFY